MQAKVARTIDAVAADLPWSPEAEGGLLSAVFHDPIEGVAMVRRSIPPEAFFRAQYREIWETMLGMSDDNVAIDPLIVTQRLRDAKRLDQVGGPGAIMEIYTAMPMRGQLSEYLDIVRERWLMREAITAHADSIDRLRQAALAEEMAGIPEAILAGSEQVFGVCQKMADGKNARDQTVLARHSVANWLDHMDVVMQNRGKIMGLATGIHEIDQALHGLDDHQGEITVFAARPGQGKTAMACSIIKHFAIDEEYPGIVFSAEMTEDQLWSRLILGAAGIDTSKAITGHFSAMELKQIAVWSSKFEKSPLAINASSYLTSADLRTEVQIAKRTRNIRWIVVDHLHLIKAVSPAGKKDERLGLVEIMETLQFIKKKYSVAVLLLVQLSRETDRNPGKPPVLADISGSAAIEQYADHVIFIHREPYFRAWHTLKEETQQLWRDTVEARRDRNPQCWSDGMKYDDDQGGWARQDYEEDALLFVRKNRRGPTPDMRVRFQSELTVFSSRMPQLNSNNPLDHQMGSYLTGRAGNTRPAAKATAANKPKVSVLGPQKPPMPGEFMAPPKEDDLWEQ